MKQHRPWYRERLVWFVIALPASAIVAGIVTIVIATRTSDGMVADDYYKQGLAINQTLARDELARQLGLRATLRVDARHVVASLEGLPGARPPGLWLTLVHPTRAGEDQTIHLRDQGGAYVGEFGAVSEGRWLLRLEDEGRTWRMGASAVLPAAAELHIAAAADREAVAGAN